MLVAALIIALALVKIVIALAALGIVIVAGIFLFHFGRALYRRIAAPSEPQMLGSGTGTQL